MYGKSWRGDRGNRVEKGERMIESSTINHMKIRNAFRKQLKKDKYTYREEGRDARSIIVNIVYIEETEPLIINIQTNEYAELVEMKEVIGKEEERKQCEGIWIARLNDIQTGEQYESKTEQECITSYGSEKHWNLENKWTEIKKNIIQNAKEVCEMTTIEQGGKEHNSGTFY